MQLLLEDHPVTGKVFMNFSDNQLPDATPVIFLHGFPFSSDMWKQQALAFNNTHRVITYDIRGHGSSDTGDGQFSVDLFSDDLLALINATGLEKVVLCGLSMGGYIALRANEKFPERILGLVLCDTQSKADTNEAKLKRFETIKQLKEEGKEKFAAEFVKKIFAPATLEQKTKIVDQIRDTIISNPLNGICGTLLALAARTETSGSLPDIKVPVLIMTGEEDKITTPAEASFMNKSIPGSEMHLVPEAAHLSNLENPEVFNHHLSNFLNVLKPQNILKEQ